MGYLSDLKFIAIVTICGCALKPSSPPASSDFSSNREMEKYAVVDRPVWFSDEEFDSKPTAEKKFDLIHTRLVITPVWKNSSLIGKATVYLHPHFISQRMVTLNAKGMKMNKVARINIKDTLNLTYQYNGEKLSINLDKIYQKTDTLVLFIDYLAMPDSIPPEISSDKGLHFINPDGSIKDKPVQFWTQGESENNSCWFPTLDAPNQKMTQEILITIEKNYVTLSNGKLISAKENKDGTRTDYWKQDKKHSPYLVMIAGGDFAVVKDKWKDMEVNYYVEPEYEKYARMVFGKTSEMITFFSSILKYPYPWDKFSQIVVQDYVSGAMENTSAVVYNSSFQHNEREHLDNDGESTIAHELFHHWFGDVVTCESWTHLSLNESFADYSEYLWEDFKYGKDAADLIQRNALHQYLHIAEEQRVPIIRYHYENPDAMFDVHTYEKGGRVLHMLRNYVGDTVFFEVLNVYLKKFEYGTAEISDLRKCFEEIAGEDLNWFFNQWWLSPGHPEIRVNYTIKNDTLRVMSEQLQDTIYSPVFRMPLDIDVWMDDKKTSVPVVFEKTKQLFSIPISGKFSTALFDGKQQLLADITELKPFSWWVAQYYQSEKFLAKFSALSTTADSINLPEVRRMNMTALDHPFWAIRKKAIENFRRYHGIDSSLIFEKIYAMALNDPKSYVRSSAIYTLATNKNKKQTKVFLAALNDSAYSVVTAAVNALIDSDVPDLLQRLEEYKTSNNPNIVVLLGKLFVKFNITGKTDWFIEKLQKQRKNDLYNLVQQFNNYLLKVGKEEQWKGAKSIGGMLKAGNYPFWIKMELYKGLENLQELPEIKQLYRDLKTNERDKQLVEYFKLLDEVGGK
ncbi:MAG: hypothetical protein A3G23_02600 [Bacteroidetes bacterium RIFCSPLOWO2_12_FULL_37_12]|nr:MAG: hypothetical protein A3G23_02600 [Bacteroidetes bacterium RIFCSPLOWO2_12_FULL_37_12]